jgi:hypothetical protein
MELIQQDETCLPVDIFYLVGLDNFLEEYQ